MTKQGYPKIFGTAFDTLVDISQGIQRTDEGAKQNFNWLSKRELIKVKYLSPGCYKYLITPKGNAFIEYSKTEDIKNLEYHAEVLSYVGLIASIQKQQQCPAIQQQLRNTMISRLKFLGFYSNNNLTERSNSLIQHISETKSKELILAPFFKDNTDEPYIWWADWLVENIPFKEWAIILSDDTISSLDKRLYLERLKEFDIIST